jgi:hypothetical protein
MTQQGKDAVFSNSPATYVVISAVTIATIAALYYLFKCKGRGGGSKKKHQKGPVGGSKKKHQKGPVTLENPDVKYPLKLISRQEVSHDTRFFELF